MEQSCYKARKCLSLQLRRKKRKKRNNDRNFLKKYNLVIQYSFYRNICYLRSQSII